ncbi:ABC transporter substrate-binding protein [Variovorax sp. LT1R16]|uniref:ABC transporter substrate-binding protein n=1 Tax=Variovorax sp. LT1R16 TaxID=3443728 RepID=UPI003F48D5DA
MSLKVLAFGTGPKAGHFVAIDMAPLFVAKESGCFVQQGLHAETVFFADPGDNNAVLAGRAIECSTNPFILPFFAANSGVPIRGIAAAGGWGVMEVVAHAKLGLMSMDDIKGYIGAGKPKLKIATLQGTRWSSSSSGSSPALRWPTRTWNSCTSTTFSPWSSRSGLNRWTT